MPHSNDNFESRERAVRRQADEAAGRSEGRDFRDWRDPPAPSFYPHAIREFVAFASLYEGGVSAQPPPPD